MSLVGPDGQPVVLDIDAKEYVAGGLRIEINGALEGLLQKALAGAQQMAGQQVAMAVMQRGGTQAQAQAQGMTAAGKVGDPFAMEPCALAIFMLLSREIEYRDRVIKEMAKRLDVLDGGSTNLEHPYPAAPLPGKDSDDETATDSN